MAAVLTAAVAGLVTVGAGLAAIVFAVADDVVTLPDFALAVGAGAFGDGECAHGDNT
jgi:hypothetical protein